MTRSILIALFSVVGIHLLCTLVLASLFLRAERREHRQDIDEFIERTLSEDES